MVPKFKAKDEKGVWHTGLLTFMFEDIADYRDYTCDLKVIGNIYENRDLLEVSK